MCGIAGIVASANRSLPDLRERLVAMAQAMAHRGPDDEGIYLSADGCIGLANRRLAIRDRTPAGHMPMGNEDRSVWITYNGEIYNVDELRAELEGQNYRFRSCSDTEVVLHAYEAWGEDGVQRLRGMFAFAILDERPIKERQRASTSFSHPRLFLARDQMGIKPLYYARTAEAFVFASELKALLASGLVGKELSPAGLTGYLLMGSVPNPLTIYRGVSALPPASRLEVLPECLDKATPDTYWDLPAGVEEAHSQAEAVEQVQRLLAESVRIHLVSDVPLGAFLSGGLDSSSVVALMRQATDGPIRTCSMVFAEAEYSEGAYARTMAEAVGAEHYERLVTVDDLMREFDPMLAALDQPSGDGVNTYFASQTARQAGLTVALSGLGGDELFGGYPNTFGQVPQMLRGLRLAQAVPGGSTLARAALGVLPERQGWSRVRDALARPASPASAYLTRRGLFSPSEVRALVAPELWQEAAQAFDPVQHVAERADGATPSATFGKQPFEWVSRAELRTYTHDQLLRDTDAMSMAHSLEVRVPLLDVELVKAVLCLPAAVKANGGLGPKPLLRRATGDRLPAAILERRDKQGFTFPLGLWLRGPLQPRMQSVLWEVQQQGWLMPAEVQRVFLGYQSGKVHWSRLWALVALACLL